MDAKTKTYNFNILNEVVADEDFFDDKTHENIAETIHTLISTSENASTIGLEGDWGSGKSTVVEILRNKVKRDDENTLFFHFDAWAHEGDPLRRIFLESFIETISDRSKALNDIREKVMHRKRVVNVKRTTKTTLLGKLLSGAALLIPAGAALLSNVDFRLLSFRGTFQDTYWLFVFGVIFTLSPFIISIIWSVISFFSKIVTKKWIRWDLIASKEREGYTDDITEENERTSIEFERYFKRILEQYVGKAKRYKKAIIVVDNLDRVSQDEFLKIWSTLQAFFQHRNSRHSYEYMEKTWFIVPFDRKGLEIPLNRISHNPPGLISSETGEIFVSNIELITSEKRSISKSFIDKSFQIILDVPTPIMSGWDKYLTEHLESSLIDWEQVEVAEVAEVFKKYAAIKCDQSPTPRLMRNYINQLGALRLRYGDTFKVKYLAYYVILKINFNRIELHETLINRRVPSYITVIDSDELYKSLAGILFGVSQEKGMELLLSPKIKEFIQYGRVEKLKELIRDHNEAFWIVWNQVWHSIAPSRTLSEDYKYNLVRTIDECFDQHSRLSEEINLLEDIVTNTELKREFGQVDYQDMFLRLGRLVSNKEKYYGWLKSTYVSYLERSIVNLGEGKSVGEIEQVKELNRIRKILIDNGEVLEQKHFKTLDLKGFINWKDVLKEYDVKFEEVLPSESLLKDIAHGIIRNRMIDGTYALEALYLVLSYPLTYKSDFDELLDELLEWSYNPVIQHNNREESLFGYKLLLAIYSCGSEAHREKISLAVKDQRFLSQVNQNYPQVELYILVLLCLCLEANIESNQILRVQYKQYINKALNAKEEEIFSEVVKEYRLQDDVLELARNGYKFVVNALVELIENDGLREYTKVMLYFDEIDCLSKNFPNESVQKKLIAHFLSHNSLGDIEKELFNDPLSHERVIYLLCNIKKKEYESYCLSLINSLSKEQWKNCFTNNSYLLDVTFKLHWEANSNYIDAFEWFYKSIVQGDKNTPDEWFFNQFGALLSVIPDPNVSVQNITEAYFDTVEDKLDDEGFNGLKDHLKDFIKAINKKYLERRINFWLEKELWGRIKWILIDGKLKTFKANANLQRKITDLYQQDEQDSETKTLLESLAKRLQFRLK